MSKSQVDGTGLLVAVVAAALALTLVSGPFAWLGSICGLVLAIVLLGFDREGYRTLFESLAFSAVFALCVTVAIAVLLSLIAANQGETAPFNGRVSGHWMPLFWVGITILFWPIDRARMSGRVQQQVILPSASPFSFSAQPVPPPQPAAPAPSSAGLTFTQPSFSQPAPEPVWTQAVAPPSPVVPAPPAERAWTPPPIPPAPEPAPLPAPAAPIAPPAPPPFTQPAPVPVPSGKETMIYVTLVDEGLNVLRAVRAEHLGRDYYKIVEPMPDGETWQFGPGQVVRAKKKNLSSRKAMVATEEAPRAR